MTRKILIVEDDAATAAYVAKGLAEAGFAVEQTGDGREGLFLASDGLFDAIVADRMLPGLDGLAMIAAIRAARFGSLDSAPRRPRCGPWSCAGRKRRPASGWPACP